MSPNLSLTLFITIWSLYCYLKSAMRFLFFMIFSISSCALSRACSLLLWASSDFLCTSCILISRWLRRRWGAFSSFSWVLILIASVSCLFYYFLAKTYWFFRASSCFLRSIWSSTCYWASSICLSLAMTFAFSLRYCCFLSVSAVPLTTCILRCFSSALYWYYSTFSWFIRSKLLCISLSLNSTYCFNCFSLNRFCCSTTCLFCSLI